MQNDIRAEEQGCCTPDPTERVVKSQLATISVDEEE